MVSAALFLCRSRVAIPGKQSFGLRTGCANLANRRSGKRIDQGREALEGRGGEGKSVQNASRIVNMFVRAIDLSGVAGLGLQDLIAKSGDPHIIARQRSGRPT